MKTNKTMFMLIIGAVLISMAFSACAEESLRERVIDETPAEGEDSLIAPNPDAEEPLVIAPSPTEEDVNIQILDAEENSEIIDTANSDIESAKEIKTAGLNLGIQAAIISGAVFVLLIALIVLRRKK